MTARSISAREAIVESSEPFETAVAPTSNFESWRQMDRIALVLKQEAEKFVAENSAIVDRILIAPKDYTEDSVPYFKMLIVMKGVEFDEALEDRVTQFDVMLANTYAHENFHLRCTTVPFMKDNESYASLAAVYHLKSTEIKAA